MKILKLLGWLLVGAASIYAGYRLIVLKTDEAIEVSDT